MGCKTNVEFETKYTMQNWQGTVYKIVSANIYLQISALCFYLHLHSIPTFLELDWMICL